MLNIPFFVIAFGSTFVDVVVALCVVIPSGLDGPSLNRPSVRPISIKRLVTAWLAAGFSLLLKVLILAPVGISRFGMIHFGFLYLGLSLPLTGFILLLLSLWSRKPSFQVVTLPAVLLLAFSLLGMLICGYSTFIEPFRLQLESANLVLPVQRQGVGSIQIGVLTDVQTDHVGLYEISAIDRLVEQKPDIILIPGDFHQMDDDVFEVELPQLRRLLGRLNASSGVYLVTGDTDEDPERIRRLIEGTSIRWLDNALASLTVRDRAVTIGGLRLDVYTPAAQNVISTLENTTNSSDVRILLSHRPDSVLQLQPNSRVDLVVSGHTHGGQIVVPGFGPLMTLSHVPRKVAAGGLHHLSGNSIYVSRGVGCERAQAPRIRLFCPPEISLLHLGTSAQAPRTGSLNFSVASDPITRSF